MPYKEKETEKLYYTIGEVAEHFRVNASLIRFWEKEFSAINPKKNKKGNRLFTKDDLQVIAKIYQLVKIDGFTLDGAKQKLKESSAQINPNNEIYRKLALIKQQLIDLNSKL